MKKKVHQEVSIVIVGDVWRAAWDVLGLLLISSLRKGKREGRGKVHQFLNIHITFIARDATDHLCELSEETL